MPVFASISAENALLLADAMLYLHVLVVLANILPVPIIIIGAVRGWGFVRRAWFRLGHLALMGVVAVQAWMGETCPLTIWERSLRARAGDAGYADQGFISHWMESLLYIEASPAFFVALYTGWCLLIIALFIVVPMRRSAHS